MPGAALRRGGEILREDGPSAFWFKLLGETCYRRIRLFERSLDKPLPPRPTRPDITLGLLRAADASACRDLRSELTSEVVGARLKAGEACVVAWDSERIVGMVWAVRQRGWIQYLGRAIDLGPDDFYLYEVSVHPDFRGRGIAGALFDSAYHQIRESGGTRAVFAVNLDNEPAHRALTRSGEREYSIEKCLWLFRWRRDWRHVRSTEDRGPNYWDTVIDGMTEEPHYLDDLLASLKKRAYRSVLERWATDRPRGPVLKTDLFEEANEVDAIFPEVPNLGGDGIGMDVSPGVARRATDGNAITNSVCVAGDARHIPFATQSIAMVFSPSTLDHFADPNELGRSLREIRRVLLPDGVLILTLDNRQNVFDPLLRLFARVGWIPYYLGRSYSVREMRSELIDAGFLVDDTTSLIQHPRLVGVAATRLSRRLGWGWWSALTRRVFLWGERLEDSPIKYFTGCFVGARAVPDPTALRGAD